MKKKIIFHSIMLTLIICTIGVHITFTLKTHQATYFKEHVDGYIFSKTNYMDKLLNSCFDEMYELRSIICTYGEIERFNEICKDIKSRHPEVSLISISKNNQLKYIYPNNITKEYINDNFINNNSYKKDVIYAVKSNKFILSDPSEKNNNNLVGILPVYVKTNSNLNKLWGVITFNVNIQNDLKNINCYSYIKDGKVHYLNKNSQCLGYCKKNITIFIKGHKLVLQACLRKGKGAMMVYKIHYIIWILFGLVVGIFAFLLLDHKRKLREQNEEQRKVKKALYDSQEKYRLFFEICPISILIYDVESYKMLEANPAFFKMLGVTEEEFKNNFQSFVSDNNCEGKIKSIIMEIKDNGDINSKILKCKKFNGDVIDVQVTFTPIYENDIFKRLLLCAKDVTERNRIQELEKQSQENTKLLNETLEYDKVKTEFFANISHELRTPLNVILSAIQMVDVFFNKEGECIKKQDVEKYKTNIKQNCFRLLRLIGNLIDVTRLDVGFLYLNLREYDIVALIEDITMSVVEYAKSKSLELIFDTDIEEKVIVCDPDKIERILLNLLSNAIKFTEPGDSIFVNIYDKNEFIEIHVKDTGIGIPTDMQSKIFERFRQVDKTLAREHEGSGIGLSLVKSFIEMHGGTIKVESEYGKGSEFIFTLPTENKSQNSDVPVSKKFDIIRSEHVERASVEFSDIYLNK